MPGRSTPRLSVPLAEEEEEEGLGAAAVPTVRRAETVGTVLIDASKARSDGDDDLGEMTSIGARVAQSLGSDERQQEHVGDTKLSLEAVVKLKQKAMRFHALIDQSESPLLDAVAMPVPYALQHALSQVAPIDAACLETARDAVLSWFAQRGVNRVFLALAAIAFTLVGVAGLIIAWAVLGLFMGVPNGWTHVDENCLACAANVTNTSIADVDLGPMEVPTCDAQTLAKGICPASCRGLAYCTANQLIFNGCIKSFVIIFSYINFLPIPWRFAILHHAWCSTRDQSEPGLDFYGRPTKAVWFHIPRPTRRKISLGLNLAYLFHFGSVAGHMVYFGFHAGQSLPGALSQNVPFVLSIMSQVTAVVLQARAEKRLVGADVGKPPSPGKFVVRAWRNWRSANRMSRAHRRSIPGAQPVPSYKLRFIWHARQQRKAFMLAKIHYRTRHSKRRVMGLTGIEKEKKPKLTEDQAAAKIAAAERGRKVRAQSKLRLSHVAAASLASAAQHVRRLSQSAAGGPGRSTSMIVEESEEAAPAPRRARGSIRGQSK